MTEAARQRALPLVGRDVDELCDDPGAVYRELAADSQLRWLGPEKGVVHLALAAVMNAVWDLAARRAGKPLWRLLAEMTPEELVERGGPPLPDRRAHPGRGVGDAAGDGADPGGADRAARRRGGYPCYTTSAGWLGYDDDKLRRLLQGGGRRRLPARQAQGRRRPRRRHPPLAIAREVIGWDVNLMIDANQVWDVPQAIEWVGRLAEFRPLWIEEPTSPDDVLGHAAIRAAVAPIGVATGEHGMNRVLFKQMFQAGAIDYCQLDSARLASVNEILAVYLMAKKFDVPVCPHAGGVGLCELVQHLAIFDYVAVSGTLDNRVTEYVDHLHEHFVDPCIVAHGHYELPEGPGYGARMFDESVARFAYPAGAYWRSRTPGPAGAVAPSMRVSLG